MNKQIILIIGLFFIVSCNLPVDTVSNKTFEEANEMLNNKLDSLEVITKQISYDVVEINYNIDTLKTGQKELLDNQEYLLNEIDTLKKGQGLIYSAITSRSRSSLRRLIENW